MGWGYILPGGKTDGYALCLGGLVIIVVFQPIILSAALLQLACLQVLRFQQN